MSATLDDAFGPKDLEAMFRAYEEVCHALHINGDAGARETIAVRVVELARRGERCPTFLRDQVILEGFASMPTTTTRSANRAKLGLGIRNWRPRPAAQA